MEGAWEDGIANWSRQSGYYLPVLRLRKGAKGLGAYVASRSGGKRAHRGGFIVWRLQDQYRIIMAHHQIECLDLGPPRPSAAFRLLEPLRAVLDGFRALLSIIHQRDVGWQSPSPLFVPGFHAPWPLRFWITREKPLRRDV